MTTTTHPNRRLRNLIASGIMSRLEEEANGAGSTLKEMAWMFDDALDADPDILKRAADRIFAEVLGETVFAD